MQVIEFEINHSIVPPSHILSKAIRIRHNNTKGININSKFPTICCQIKLNGKKSKASLLRILNPAFIKSRVSKQKPDLKETSSLNLSLFQTLKTQISNPFFFSQRCSLSYDNCQPFHHHHHHLFYGVLAPKNSPRPYMKHFLLQMCPKSRVIVYHKSSIKLNKYSLLLSHFNCNL